MLCYVILVCNLPPRPSTSTSAYNDISGYMAARGEFATDYDNNAELIVRDVDFDEEKLDGRYSFICTCKYVISSFQHHHPTTCVMCCI